MRLFKGEEEGNYQSIEKVPGLNKTIFAVCHMLYISFS
jgi:hypothetical protein